MAHLISPDPITALRYDTCEKLEGCEPCKGVRRMALDALEEAVPLIEAAVKHFEIAGQWDPEASQLARGYREWMYKHGEA